MPQSLAETPECRNAEMPPRSSPQISVLLAVIELVLVAFEISNATSTIELNITFIIGR